MLRLVQFEEVVEFSELAKKEGVTINNTKRTEWFMSQNHSCGALYWIGNMRARLKGIFVHPDFRGYGYGDILTEGLIQQALLKEAKIVEAHVFSPKWYLNRGFEVTKKFKTVASDGREFYKVIKFY